MTTHTPSVSKLTKADMKQIKGGNFSWPCPGVENPFFCETDKDCLQITPPWCNGQPMPQLTCEAGICTFY
jgi:hypothetical protein